APGEPLIVAEMATLLEQQGRVDEAIAAYETLYERNPHLDFAANNLAMLLVSYRKDQRSLDRARDLTADFAKSQDGALLDTHGWVRFQRGEYNDALPVLERAVERAPNANVVRYHLGMAEWKAGQRERAQRNLETAVAGSASFSGADEARSV